MGIHPPMAEARERLGSLYKPGQRGWLKVKNRAYWKYELEREAAVTGSWAKASRYTRKS
jgi:hypothetical protein